MRKLLITITTLLFSATFFFATAQTDNTTDKGVEINGVIWATRNVDDAGTFAPAPEITGKFYQWNRKRGWDATFNNRTLSTNVSEYPKDWNNRKPKGKKWTKRNDPSPKGWRVPTIEEIRTLLDRNKVSSEWISYKGINGYKFTDKETGNSIFLPAKLSRYLDSGLVYTYRDGNYWSSTQNGDKNAHCLSFYVGYNNGTPYIYTINDYKNKRGFFVRPVQDKTKYRKLTASDTTQKTECSFGQITPDTTQKISETTKHSSEGVEINGIIWATRNVEMPGKFANRLSDMGMFYKWNHKQSFFIFESRWNDTIPVGNKWEEINNPCPNGWRVPTKDEIEDLLDESKVFREWTIINGVRGIKFTDKVNGNSIFLRAAGYRNTSNGAQKSDITGLYWSNTEANIEDAYCLQFGEVGADLEQYIRSFGFSVRCIAE
jgi:uncharacterized protein (TIGR02145 family)